MAVLTRAQRERGVALAQQERSSRWAWGGWALDVAGPVGEDRGHNQALGKLQAGLDEIAAHAQVGMSELPSLSTLRKYRDAADAIPAELRDRVPTTSAGWRLGAITDRRERLNVIEQLAAEHPKEIVTVDAVERHLGRRPPHPTPEENGLMPIPEHPEEKIAQAEELLRDEEVAAAVVGGQTDASRNVKEAVHEQSMAKAFARTAELDEDARARALALPAYIARMNVKMGDFTHDLVRLGDHLDQLVEYEHCRIVTDKHRALVEAAEHNIAVLNPMPGLPENIIEGRVVE